MNDIITGNKPKKIKNVEIFYKNEIKFKKNQSRNNNELKSIK